MIESEKIFKILDFGSKQEKITSLESLSKSEDMEIIKKIISMLDDPDIEVRGEAFSCLVLNENKISKPLIQSLNSESKYIRGFVALVLANRKDLDAISAIIDLTKDKRSMVRSCALGALGYLKAQSASKVIHNCFSDSNLEVKKSALKAAIDIRDVLSAEEIDMISREKDDELEKLLVIAKQNC